MEAKVCHVRNVFLYNILQLHQYFLKLSHICLKPIYFFKLQPFRNPKIIMIISVSQKQNLASGVTYSWNGPVHEIPSYNFFQQLYNFYTTPPSPVSLPQIMWLVFAKFIILAVLGRQHLKDYCLWFYTHPKPHPPPKFSQIIWQPLAHSTWVSSIKKD